MITEAVLGAVFGFVSLLLGWMPSMELPTWLTVLDEWAAGIATIGHFGNVIPLGAIGNAAVFLLACTVMSWAISTGRMTVSHLTGGGGAK